MRPLHAAFLALAGCATAEPAEEVPNRRAAAATQSAHGADPLWHLTIWPDRISLLVDTGGRGREADFQRASYANVRETRSGGVRRWQAGRGTAVISVEIRDGPCVQSGWDYRQVARVRLSGRELNGCGGSPPMMRPM
jgi:uncharacterized membrane protein